MFGIEDIPKFILAFFVLLPVISAIHEGGHVFFAWLMGGKNIRITIGTGKPVFRWGLVEVRQYYFWYGFCTFDNITRQRTIANILIFSGGVLFNLLAAIAVILLVEKDILEEGLFAYQFTYFSLYYIFFALIPIPFPDGGYSDGRIILDLIRGKENIITPRVYYVRWDQDGNQWRVFDDQEELIASYEGKMEALNKANEVARSNRPSMVMNSKGGKETEISNYPRIPL
ncbi:site-2 protease family protein [Sphingobacterium gobiense]|uniref:Peptidase M50 domain-containing protein n=1 Tax=Sphingobacterium gobiense TaxID=1382456 RepID=A0A2S9JNU4_9SPHI|nr:site-2 protease family protein [Sphingobacterium gobiense]PRD54659.1 hypothetical protein C5749_14570 [Sphingobacterium gobiense]